METAVPEDLSKDYIKTLLSIVEEDKKAILLYVAFDLAVVSLTLSEKLLQDKGGREPFLASGLACCCWRPGCSSAISARCISRPSRLRIAC